MIVRLRKRLARRQKAHARIGVEEGRQGAVECPSEEDDGVPDGCGGGRGKP